VYLLMRQVLQIRQKSGYGRAPDRRARARHVLDGAAGALDREAIAMHVAECRWKGFDVSQQAGEDVVS
jgi:hypothetical protein